MRKEKNGNRYFSFDEVAQSVFNLKPYDPNILRHEEKREELKKKFEATHMCNSCHTPMTYKGGNIVACTNSDCSKQCFHLLNERSKNLASILYNEKEVKNI